MPNLIGINSFSRAGLIQLARNLASKEGGFIKGQNIIVDGGTTISDGN
jgi:hypothetical protein